MATGGPWPAQLSSYHNSVGGSCVTRKTPRTSGHLTMPWRPPLGDIVLFSRESGIGCPWPWSFCVDRAENPRMLKKPKTKKPASKAPKSKEAAPQLHEGQQRSSMDRWGGERR
ncbi:uncharacterized protein STAUR_7965 [Stigmatella aurantiaca DW4/3-1]|uniref:Uncharacterized protein n=1 Tax=Stigmatella aurantiaca (strain DW4/3-1) TaxID=378806 RepID=E3FQ17_STIAD|nr:uncharacterized protein STAUR_7965 [Stigmatella aurantiaca DW4/3-1]